MFEWITWTKVIAVVTGGGLGYAYYAFIGCKTGTCLITSTAWSNVLYGAVFGALIAWSH